MLITRRDFLKYATVSAAALGLTSSDLFKLKETLAREGGLNIVWLHGASCSGDSTSLLNSIGYLDPVQTFVVGDVDLDFHQTVMNAAGTDLAGATNGLDLAINHLGGAGVGNFADWTQDTVKEGTHSIKLRVGNRCDTDYYVDAKIYLEAPLKLNEFKICYNFKTGESQAPFIVLDLENQDTGTLVSVFSTYPLDYYVYNARDVDPNTPVPMQYKADPISGPKDWKPDVCINNHPFWQVGQGPPTTIDVDVDPVTGLAVDPAWKLLDGKETADGYVRGLRDDYGTYRINTVRIVNRGNPVVGANAGIGCYPCTIYIDEIRIGGIQYADLSELIRFNSHPTGADASDVPFVLCIEGSVVTGTPPNATYKGEYCEVGPMVPGTLNETMLNAFLEYSKKALAVVAVGTCASFGGIPGVGETSAKGCAEVLRREGIRTPVINIPGCPAHPDWIVGTLAMVIARGVDGVELDRDKRVKDYYPRYVCNGNIDKTCPWLYNNDIWDSDADADGVDDSCTAGRRCPDGVPDDPGGGPPNPTRTLGLGQSRGLAKYKWGSVPAGGVTYSQRVAASGAKPSRISINYAQGTLFEGCLGVLGCRGRRTKADCAYRKWNADISSLTPVVGPKGVNWCVGSRGGCQGCTEKNFPSKRKFYYFR